MIDTERSQMHVVDHGAPSTVKAEEGSVWLFTAEQFDGLRPFTILANCEGFSEGIEVGDVLVIDCGMARFEVIEKIGNDLHCKCTDPGLFLLRAKFSFWRDGKLVERNFWASYSITKGVDAIFVYTKYGHMASLLSLNRPYPPIFAFTNDSDTRMALNLQWGVVPLLVDLLDNMEGNISRTMDLMKTRGMVKPRDAVLVVSDLTPTIPNPTAFQAIQVKKVD